MFVTCRCAEFPALVTFGECRALRGLGDKSSSTTLWLADVGLGHSLARRTDAKTRFFDAGALNRLV